MGNVHVNWVNMLFIISHQSSVNVIMTLLGQLKVVN